MSALALLLLSLAVADVARAVTRGDPGRVVVVGSLAGLATLAAGAVLSGRALGPDLLLGVLTAAAVVGWVVLSAEERVRRRGAGPPLVVLVGAAALVLLLAGWAGPTAGSVARWLAWTPLPGLQALSPDRAVLLLALLLLQLATGNVVVRLVLIQVGALPREGVPQPAERLRGGRVLGPMERLIILGLGLAGEVTAASLVIAAKGLIRWPELHQSASELEGVDPATVGVDQVTEYFLVGSMVSWLVALSALGVAQLG